MAIADNRESSEALVRIAAQHQPHESIIADNLGLPHPRLQFDFAISIAVVHHLSTAKRRVQAVEAILETLRPVPYSCDSGVTKSDAGKVLIYVWALEQKSSRRGWDESDEQDVMVPWVMKHRTSRDGAEQSKTFERYYHLYRRGELENDIMQAGGVVIEHGYEKDNWWAIATHRATKSGEGS